MLAQAGLGSRRHCDELIAMGRVAVNDQIAAPGTRIDVDRDRVTVDGLPVPLRPGLVYYLLNKPRGVVSTVRDPRGRATVTDFVPPSPRVFPVGRLDADSEGIIILTNDGDLSQWLTHPSHGIPKEYLVEVEGSPGPAALRHLREGVELSDGMTAPARVGVPSPGTLRVTVHQGRNRLVRRMCDAVGHPVHRLVRVRIGPLTDPKLPPGRWRTIQAEEVRALFGAGGGTARPSRLEGPR